MTQTPQFGILVLQEYPYRELVARWQAIEAAGFESLWVADHFVDPYQPEALWFDGWSLLPAAATVTSRIRLGALVTSITLHNPAMLARQAMTVDHISGGRLILGLGAGRAPLDHSMTGTPYWEIPERVRRFREFAEITHQMLTQRTSSYQGQYYQVTDAIVNPAPVQQPRPPLMLAAHGDMTFKLATRLADVWNTFLKFNATTDEALAIAREHNRKLDEFCALIGREPTSLRRSLLLGLTRDFLFSGREAFRETIGRYREAGFDEFLFYWTGEEPSPIFPDWRTTTIASRTTLEWVAEECAALRRASSGA